MPHATNAYTMRIANRKLILDLIRRQPISRVELAAQAHLTRASITQIVDELIEMGLVKETTTIGNGKSLGRHRILLALCPEARYVFGVLIHRRHCYVGCMDWLGQVLCQEKLSCHSSGSKLILQRIAEAIARQQAELQLPAEKIIGIGVSCPGPIDYKNGVILNPPNFPAWQNVPICQRLQEATGLPVTLERDANARALEEKYFGSGKSLSNFLLVQVDAGVGSGAIVNDKLYRGSKGLGAEIGHTSICYNGPQCACGNRGCLETYLQTPNLLQDLPYASVDELLSHAQEPAAAERIAQTAQYLATAIVNAINLYDLERVLLWGELAVPPLLHELNALIRARVLNRSAVADPAVLAVSTPLSIRPGAMAALHAFFQEKR